MKETKETGGKGGDLRRWEGNGAGNYYFNVRFGGKALGPIVEGEKQRWGGERWRRGKEGGALMAKRRFNITSKRVR